MSLTGADFIPARTVYFVMITRNIRFFESEQVFPVGVYSTLDKAQAAIRDDIAKEFPHREIVQSEHDKYRIWNVWSHNACPHFLALISKDGRHVLADLDMYHIEEFIEDAEIG